MSSYRQRLLAAWCQNHFYSFAAAVSLSGAIFGPGSVFAPIYLDNVFCIGNESNLLNCRRNPIGVHDCSHSQDVSVDCLGRVRGTIHTYMYTLSCNLFFYFIFDLLCIVGEPCSSVGEIRLVGGMDDAQGRVEVCTEDFIYSTVCSSGWDNLDAQVVCRQLEFGI